MNTHAVAARMAAAAEVMGLVAAQAVDFLQAGGQGSQQDQAGALDSQQGQVLDLVMCFPWDLGLAGAQVLDCALALGLGLLQAQVSDSRLVEELDYQPAVLVCQLVGQAGFGSMVDLVALGWSQVQERALFQLPLPLRARHSRILAGDEAPWTDPTQLLHAALLELMLLLVS